jgi:Fe2+ or Zn2+ uptake regulation protein
LASGKRETIEARILDYLERNPDASDTAEGIAKFWMRRPGAGTTLMTVSRALEKLVKKGSITAFRSLDGTLYYKSHKTCE